MTAYRDSVVKRRRPISCEWVYSDAMRFNHDYMRAALVKASRLNLQRCSSTTRAAFQWHALNKPMHWDPAGAMKVRSQAKPMSFLRRDIARAAGLASGQGGPDAEWNGSTNIAGSPGSIEGASLEPVEAPHTIQAVPTVLGIHAAGLTEEGKCVICSYTVHRLTRYCYAPDLYGSMHPTPYHSIGHGTVILRTWAPPCVGAHDLLADDGSSAYSHVAQDLVSTNASMYMQNAYYVDNGSGGGEYVQSGMYVDGNSVQDSTAWTDHSTLAGYVAHTSSYANGTSGDIAYMPSDTSDVSGYIAHRSSYVSGTSGYADNGRTTRLNANNARDDQCSNVGSSSSLAGALTWSSTGQTGWPVQ